MIRLASSSALYAARTSRSLLTAFRTSNMTIAQLNLMTDSKYKSEIEALPTPDTVPNSIHSPNLPEHHASTNTCHSLITTVDWDKLFLAVTARLEGCVNDAKAQRFASPVPGTAQSMQTAVLECVSDLKHLHTALVRKRKIKNHGA